MNIGEPSYVSLVNILEPDCDYFSVVNIAEPGQISLVNSCNLVCLSLIPLSVHNCGDRCFFLWSCVFICLCSSLPFAGPLKAFMDICGLWSSKQNHKFQVLTKMCIWQSNKSQLNSIPMFPFFSRRSPHPILTPMRWGSSSSRRWRFGRDVELHSGLEQMHFKGTSATSK